MEVNKILIVDDNESFLNSTEKYFKKKGWDVTTISDGNQMLNLINDKYENEKKKIVHLSDFHCMILDHLLPGANGNKILNHIRESKQRLPSTIILSGYLNEEDQNRFFLLGADLLVQKPISLEVLYNLVNLLIKKDFNGIENYIKESKTIIKNSGVALKKTEAIINDSSDTPIPAAETIINEFRHISNPDTINRDVKEREHILKEFFTNSVANGVNQFSNIKNPIFVVGRRWNSWYPSFFDVPGGAYILVMPEKDNRNEMVLIDPGFKCLKVLSENLGISIADISTCIISHNHPDHIGGVYEYMACRNTLDDKSHLFCNPTTLKMFLNHRSIQQLNNVELDLLEDWDRQRFNKILVSGFKTAHNEIGPIHKPMAIQIEFLRPNNNTEKLIILGDTEYKLTFIKKIAKHDLKILILHIGSAQLKDGTGKHLYLEGTRKLLRDLDSKLEKMHYRGKLLVLISEWGLEHATKNQLEKLCGKKLPDIDKKSPITETINYLRNELNYINILPADIGLIVDIIDQNIYTNIEKNEKFPFNEIDFIVDGDGIKYVKK